jgi:putative ABC transport system permease protein
MSALRGHGSGKGGKYKTERMFWRLLGRTVAARKARAAMVVLAIMTGAAVTSALLTTMFSVRDDMASEFRRFGPNIVVSPLSSTIEVGLPGISLGTIKEQGYINESDIWKIKRIPTWNGEIMGYAPFLYQQVLLSVYGKNINAVMAGTYFSHPEPNITDGSGNAWVTGVRRMSAWGVRGSWVAGDQDLSGAMVGTALGDVLNLHIGSEIKVIYRNPASQDAATGYLNVTGFVYTGGAEDSQIFVNMRVAQGLSSRPGMVHLVQVSALTSSAPAETIASEIQASIPSVEARSTMQLAQAEDLLMQRTETLVGLVAAAAMGASALGVMTTMTTGVWERRREMGIMKALGASDRRIAALVLSEAAILGTAGGLAGYVLGIGLARYIGSGFFGRTGAFEPVVLPLTLAISAVAALAASALPVSRALGVQPAAVLRGD